MRDWRVKSKKFIEDCIQIGQLHFNTRIRQNSISNVWISLPNLFSQTILHFWILSKCITCNLKC